jgi:Purple acid Phosphatase, N-terminal domain/Calcineurin-like phosphoesterase
MRAPALVFSLVPLLLSFAACSDDDDGDEPFTDVGGTLKIDGCGYSVTTRMGAEPPRKASDTRGLDPTPFHVHLGFIGDPRTSIVAQWRTKDEITRETVIRYAQGADLSEAELTEKKTGIQFGYRATGAQIYRVHQAHLCGLEPGTAYSYQVGSDGAFSPVYTFRTAPDVEANPDAEVVFGFVGDSRDGYDVWSQLVTQLKQRSPDLILFSGDAVTIGITQFEWEEFLARGEPLFARVPVILAHGNHEVNSVNYFAQFAMPGDQENFSFDFGHAHLTVANDTPTDIAAIQGSTREWLASDFEASKGARWRMLMNHQAFFSSATAHGSSLTLQQAWMPLVDQYRLDLVLNGHDHEYEISKPIAGGVPQASNTNATVYVVGGGAGAELYDIGSAPHTAYAEKTHSAAVIRVTRNTLELDPFRQDGSAISVPEARFSKTK